MSGVKKLEVRLRRAPGDERIVGQLAESDRRLFFEYDTDFLRAPLGLSPFQLPPESGLLEHCDLAFGPVWGLFDDSLPDGWGRLLMDRHFAQRGSRLAEISVLDRLAYLGTRTMGALTYHPPAEATDLEKRFLDLFEMAQAAEEVLRGAPEEVLPALLRAGGSPGGARPKVLVGVSGESILSGEDDLPEGYSPWLVKFPAPEDPADAGPREMAYSTMAREAGLLVPPTRLFEGKKGRRGSRARDLYFGVERFDREGNRRFHVHTFGNLIHANFRVPSCDYGQLLHVTRVLTKDHREVIEAFRRMVWNVATHNRDDHAKNFAFRMAEDGTWQLAPAYDLVFSQGPGGEHSTTIAGEGRNPTRRHLLALAPAAGIASEAAEALIEEVTAAVARWRTHAREADVRAQSVGEIEREIARCLARLAS